MKRWMADEAKSSAKAEDKSEGHGWLLTGGIAGGALLAGGLLGRYLIPKQREDNGPPTRK